MRRRSEINFFKKYLRAAAHGPSVLDYLREPVAVLSGEGRVVDANDAFSELSEVRKEGLLGKKRHEVPPLGEVSESISRCILERAEKSEQITYGKRTFNVTATPVFEEGRLMNVCVVFRDISTFVQLEKALLKRNRELAIINTISGAFISSRSIGSVFEDLLEKVLVVSDFNIGWIAVNEEKGFSLKCSSGVSPIFRQELEEGVLNYVYGDIMKTLTPLYVLEAKDVEGHGLLVKEGIVFFAGIPLRYGAETIGILVLASRIDVEFDFEHASLFSLIGKNITLIAEKIMLFQETQRLAITDGLSGLYNVRYFYDSLDKEIERTRRYSAVFSLILFDIDDFKALNDTFGHQAGDEVLRAVSSIFKGASRKADMVARYGGEEFILMLPNTSKEEAAAIAGRLKELIEDSDYIEGEKVKITLSGGIASFPEDAPDAKTLLYAADMAMYEAKAKGKKKVCAFRGGDE